MSASSEYTEWHLTPAGWVRGSTRIDFGNIKIQDAPIDRVLTYTWSENSNGYSPIYTRLEESWRSMDAPRVDELIRLHGQPPRRL